MALIWDTLASDIKRHEERHAEIARTHARIQGTAFFFFFPFHFFFLSHMQRAQKWSRVKNHFFWPEMNFWPNCERMRRSAFFFCARSVSTSFEAIFFVSIGNE